MAANQPFNLGENVSSERQSGVFRPFPFSLSASLVAQARGWRYLLRPLALTGRIALMKLVSSLAVGMLVGIMVGRGRVLADDSIDFARDVRPLLSDRCFACHGPDSHRREADLRLDVREAAYEVAIQPGDPEASELVARIFSQDPDVVMPPPDSKLELDAAERETLRRWIAGGAPYDDHWSFLPVRAPPLEEHEVAEFVSPIDYFVDRQLKLQGIEPSAEADKATLIRRLTFDLTGLPPTPREFEDFLADQSEDSYERLVDRLLASERFGERMAIDWLDVARYADTYGYQNDRYRPMWPWRDWVVRAFNENLPYDQFITWQIAGDLLPGATDEQILATAFNRNHRQTNEGGSVEEEFRAEYVADRVNTFGAAFLGLTLECCRCHDHKYDPLTQEEYYQLAAFFNSIDESGLYSHFTQATPTPTLVLADGDQAVELNRLQHEIEVKQQTLRELAIDEAAYLNWRSSLKDVRPLKSSAGGKDSLREQLAASLATSLVGDYPLEELEDGKLANRAHPDAPGKTADNPQIQLGKVGNGLHLSGDNNATFPAGGDFTRNQPFSIALWLNAPRKFERAVVFHRSRAWTDSGSRGYELLIEEGKLSAALIHFWPGNAIRIVTDEPLPIDRWTHVCVVYDGSSQADGLQIFVDGKPASGTVVRDKLTKHIQGADGFGGGGVHELAVGERFRDVGFKDGAVDELKVFNRALSRLEVQQVFSLDAFPDNVSEMLYNAPEELLREYFLRWQGSFLSLSEQLRELRDARSRVGDAIPEIMVMREEPTPRPTFVLARGAYDAPGARVRRGTPAKILPQDHGQGANRRDLAQWLVDPEHPLTSRVAVNRFWQMLFGRGLVRTPEDFGLQGSLPSHPQLLDWLAGQFMQSGWDVKRLFKTIVMSSTYRQRSDLTPELYQADPENILLARGPVVRLPAEMIRDAALFASDLLVERRGGPPAKPYQPEGLWEEKSGEVYARDVGEGSHRRSLYTFWKRTSPPPSMMTLDANNREVCAVQRQSTLTPMQILVLLNDPQYVEAAKALAQKSMHHFEQLDDQLTFSFQSLVTRVPDSRELDVLRRLYDQQYAIFAEQPDEAQQLLSIGDLVVDEELNPIALAAMTMVTEGLMSFDETVMKR